LRRSTWDPFEELFGFTPNVLDTGMACWAGIINDLTPRGRIGL